MMNRRRSLFVIGCLVAALAAFAPDAVFAQAGDIPATGTTGALAANGRGHDTIRLTWEHTAGAGGVEAFSIRYQEGDETNSGSVTDLDEMDFLATQDTMRMEEDPKTGSSNDYSVTIDGLKPGTDYVFGVTPLAKALG